MEIYIGEDQLTVQMREYIVDETEGLSIIQILSDGFCTCFKSISDVLVASWPDCEGSLGQYYALSGYSLSKKIRCTYELNQVLMFGESLGYTNEDLFHEINNFLKLFSPGTYHVYLLNKEHDLSYIIFSANYGNGSTMTSEKSMRGWYYPLCFDINLFSTLPEEKINNERVDYYIDLIKNGIFPKAIIYHHNYYGTQTQINMSGCEYYIVDGHHKLKAYEKCGVYPNFICIEKVDIKAYEASLYESVSSILNREERRHLKETSQGK